ncbi:MAG: flagellar basal body L-ring protein FlgH [Gemmatimonadales bacterium]|nr:MAG: flagellar basal body L-ring protein FlgH [Gemmatimonadales bacterium]
MRPSAPPPDAPGAPRASGPRPRGAPPLLAALALLLVGGAVQAPALEAQTMDAPRQSWTSDLRMLQVGDIVTILVNESTLATANRTDVRSDDRNRDLGIGFNVDGEGSSGSARTRADLSDRFRGESSRQERFVTEVSARVVEQGENGLVRVEGEKRVVIDNHEQQIAISGWVRSQDISRSNTVPSIRLADAEVSYGSRGNLGRVRGIWWRMFGWLWP